MGLDQPRLLHIEVLCGSFPLLLQQLHEFVALVGFKDSNLVFQLPILALKLFELLVDEKD